MRHISCNVCKKMKTYRYQPDHWWTLDPGAGIQSEGKKEQDICEKCIEIINRILADNGVHLDLGV